MVDQFKDHASHELGKAENTGRNELGKAEDAGRSKAEREQTKLTKTAKQGSRDPQEHEDGLLDKVNDTLGS